MTTTISSKFAVSFPPKISPTVSAVTVSRFVASASVAAAVKFAASIVAVSSSKNF